MRQIFGILESLTKVFQVHTLCVFIIWVGCDEEPTMVPFDMSEGRVDISVDASVGMSAGDEVVDVAGDMLRDIAGEMTAGDGEGMAGTQITPPVDPPLPDCKDLYPVAAPPVMLNLSFFGMPLFEQALQPVG